MTMQEAKVQAQFQTRVSIYDQRSAWILDQGLLDAIVRTCRVGRDADLLDVCCGTGAVGGAFAGRVRHRVGLDLTEAMLTEARKRLDEVRQGSAYELPFPAASFDLVVSRQAVHFLTEPARAVAEMHRVLRPGGQVILAQRVPYGDPDAAWMKELNELKQPLLKTFIREEDLRAALIAAGFASITATDYPLWESINAWVESPEVPMENRARILRHVREAPAAVRAIHPIEVADEKVLACWRWIILTANR